MDSWLKVMLTCGFFLIAVLQGSCSSRFRRSSTESTHVSKVNNGSQNHNKSAVKSVFGTHLEHVDRLQDSCTCRTAMLYGMLKVYENIFRDMINSSTTNNITILKNNLTKVENLSDKYIEEKEAWGELQSLHHIKVNHTTIQAGAINDFQRVFERAKSEKNEISS